ncbi:MAG: hypothetical protein DRP56_10820 [Planctomycetota bacterium]|nr:MAG: hypothetical protein DRP56_10820 [Planctomycetota bacterium]
MKKNKAKWIVILLVLVLMVDIVVRLSVPTNPKQPSQCLAIPMKFAMEYPDCANKLIQAVNLTNIHIVPPGTLEARRYNQSKLYKMPRQRSLTNQTE